MSFLSINNLVSKLHYNQGWLKRDIPETILKNSLVSIAMNKIEFQLQYKQIAANASHLKPIPDLARDWCPVIPSGTQRSLSISLL